MMAWPTIVCGALCVFVGVNGYLNGTPDDTGNVSPTALIPAGVGAVLIVCGALAFQEKLRKHVMHAAAMVGVLGVVGGFVPLIRQAAKGKEFDPFAPAARNGLLMGLVCAVFVFLCVRSFIAARKARQAAAA
jgi:uncharacterized membrane protein